MSIKLYEEKELYPDSEIFATCPSFVCEWCGQPIRNTNALYFWYVKKENYQFVDRQIHVVHKGDCERRLNHVLKQDNIQQWDEIRDLLLYLLINTGVIDNKNSRERLFEKIHDYLFNKEDN